MPSTGRTIVFDVSGYIRLPSGSNGTRLTSSKVTIAGQTAPGDGIGFYNNFFRISGDDIVIRHVRFRHGYYGSGGDCVDLDSGCLNAILDHVSMQFSTDENMSSFGSPPENLTLQYSIDAWGLESHSCGGLWDQNHASSHHNLWASNHTRNPKARPNGLLEWVNNVTYDWDIGFIMGDSNSSASWKANVLNNYFICPPGNIHSKALEKANLDGNGNPNFSLFMSGNYYDGNGNGTLDGALAGYEIASGSYAKPGVAFANTGSAAITTDVAPLAYKKIVSNGGPLRTDVAYPGTLRDEVDTILFGKLTTQTRAHVTRESATGASNSGFGTLNSTTAPIDTDKDGMPDYYESALLWNPAVQDHNTALANSGGVISGVTFLPNASPAGYTRLEEYLHFLTLPHGVVAKSITGSPTSIVINLAKFTSGFTATPTFTTSNVIGGTVALGGAGNSIATFSPTVNFTGRARFDFTVTDTAGHSWTQTCALVVLTASLPRDLSWKGVGNVWDDAALNWLRPSNGGTVAFSNGDRVTFDQSGIAQPTVTLSGTLMPATVDVDATDNYTFAGGGALTASGTLTKRGTGTLTINNTGVNGFSGVTLDAGTITLANATANGSGLGTGLLTMNSGTLNFYDPGAGGSFTATLPNALAINGTAAINTGARCGTSGNLTGGGFLNLYIPFTRTDWGGNPAGFTGTLNVITDGDGCEFRINNGGTGGVTDYGSSRLWLADKVNAYFLPNPPSTGDKTQIIQVGELATPGTGTGVFLGGSNSIDASRVVHWKVGALGTSSTFGGAIVNRTGAAMFTKVGGGTLTLTGNSTYTGATSVNAGGLLVSGSLGATAVNVASGALLGGSGTINGSIVASSGAFLSPATVPFSGGTLTVGNGLTIGATTMYCDLSGTTDGPNDKIVITGAPLTYSGIPYFQFLLLDGTLAAGDYDLITAPSSAFITGVPGTFPHNLPTGTRQTFTVKRTSSVTTPARVWLEVLNNPATLTWNGTAAQVWQVDTSATPNGWNGGTAASPNFLNFDAVKFNDSAPSTAVAVAGVVQPRSMEVNNSTKNYTFGGNGAIAGNGILTKSGTGSLTITLPASVGAASTNTANSTTVTVASATGLAVGMFVEGNGVPAGTTITAVSGTTLTLSQAVTAANTGATFTYNWRNTYSGGTVIENGSTVQLGNEAANRWGLGTGKVTFKGGTLKLYDFGTNFPGSGDFPNAMVVPLGQTGNLYTPQRGSLSGSLSGDATGSGTLNLTIKYVRGDFYGNWSAFSGLININAAAYAEFRTAEDYSPDGFPAAEIHLGPNVVMKHVGNQSQGAGTTIAIGALSGAAGSGLLGGPIGGRALTYLIGGKGIDTTFSGAITEQAPGSTLTNIIKIGTGTLTLAGNNNWGGGTEVTAGGLSISGTSVSAGSVNVAGGATLQFINGTLTTPEVNIDPTAKLSGYGSMTGDVNCPGTFEGRGFASGTAGTVAIHGNAYFASTSILRMRAGATSDLVAVDSDLALAGTVQVSLPAGTPNGRYPLLTYGGALALGTIALTGVPAGTTAQLSTSIAGQVDLVVGDLSDSDHDGLADSWETTNFNGSLAQIGTGDPDGDGFDNETEETAGTNPNSESSIPNFTVAYYRFEEGNAGTQVPQAFSNSVVDAAGADDNMNAYSAAAAPVYSNTLPTAQIPQTMTANTRSLQFDGNDDLYTGLLGPLQSRVFGSFTVEAYVRFANLAGFQTVVGRDDDFGNANGQNGTAAALFYLSKSGIDNSFRVEVTTTGGTQLAVNSASIAAANTWYHLAAVGNVRTGTLTLYVNGASVGSVGGFTGLYNPANDNAWTIGRGQYSGAVADNVNGLIDEVRFSDQPLATSRFLVTPFAGDSDGDGLPNAWETQYFGSATAAVATEDSDGDGQNNQHEYLAGTNPKNGSSRFAASASSAVAGQFTITWPSVPGKTYLIQTNTSLTGQWTALQTVPAAGAPATSTSRTFDVNGGARFYRVLVSN